MYPIRDLAGTMPELQAELRGYSSSESVVAVASLFLDPRNHASLSNLEALLLVVLTHATGTRSPTRRELRRWCQQIGENQAANQTDAPEDVFASEVCWNDGNRLILVGRQSSTDQWLRYLLLVVGNLPTEGDFGQMCRSVQALLRLSDAALRMAGVKPDDLINDPEPGRVQVDNNAAGDVRRQAVIFSPARLASLGIVEADLQTFVLSPEVLPAVLDAGLDSSPLANQPLIHAGADYVLAMVPAVAYAIRSRLLLLLGDIENRRHFERRLKAFQAHEAERALQRLLCEPVPLKGLLDRLDSRFPTQIKRFDVNKGVVAIFVFGKIESDGLEELEQHERDSELAQAVSKSVAEAVQYLSETQGCTQGIVIVIAGGLGNFFHLELPAPPANWSYLLLSLPDFVTLSFGADARMMLLWRYLEAKRELEAGPGEVFSLAGEIAKFAFWRSQHYTFFEQWPSADHPLLVMITDDAASGMRRDARVTRGLRAAFHPVQGKWIPVQRLIASAFFAADMESRIYVRADGMKEERLRQCIETKQTCLWIEIDYPKHERHFQIVVNFLRCVSEWSARVAEAIDAGAQRMSRPVVVEVKLAGLEDWSHDEIKGSPPETPPLEAEVDHDRHRIVLTITLEFFQSFARAVNTAEKELVLGLLRTFHTHEAIPVTTEQLAALVAKIVPDDTARFFHIFANRDSLVLGAGATPMPVLVSAEAHAIVRRFRDPVIPGFERGELNDREKSRGALFISVDLIHARLLDRLRPYSRASIIALSLKNHSHVNAERQVWKLTSAAVTSLHGIREAKAVAVKQEARLAEAAVGSRLLIEAALILPDEGKQPLTREVFELCLADFVLLNEQANQADAIMSGMASPTLKLTGLGELEFDARFMHELVLAYQTDLLGERFSSYVANYPKEFEKVSDGGVRRLDATQQSFADAWEAEYGFSLFSFVHVSSALFEAAASAPDHLLIWPKSKLLAFIVDAGSLSWAAAGLLLDEFSLHPRSGFDKDIPKGYAKTEVYPWVYRRRLSPLWRPVVQIDLNTDPAFYIDGDFVRHAARYRVEAVFAGDFDSGRFRTAGIKAFVGEMATKRGAAFNKLVLREVKALGLWAEGEVELTALGAPAVGPDGRGWGDVDVLAVDARRKLVHAIECKCLMEARSVREIVNQLQEFQGDRDDSLGKHLRRVDWLKDNLGLAAKQTGQPLDKCRLKHWVVSSKVVPMQYRTAHGIDQKRFIQCSDLRAALAP